MGMRSNCSIERAIDEEWNIKTVLLGTSNIWHSTTTQLGFITQGVSI